MITPLERVLTLRSADCFADLALDRIAAIARSTVAEDLSQGTSWHPHREALFVCEGGLVAESADSRGDLRGGGDVIGMARMLAGRPVGPIRADVPSTVLLLGADALEDLCVEEFDVVETLLRWLATSMLRNRAVLPPGSSIDPVVADPQDRPPPDTTPLVRRISALARCGMIPSSQADALAELAHQAAEVTLPVDAVLWDVGDEPTGFLLLVEGEVRCEGAAGWHAHIGPNCLVGDVEALADVPRVFRATSRSLVRALEIPADGFLDILEDHPRLAIDFLALLAVRATNHPSAD